MIVEKQELEDHGSVYAKIHYDNATSWITVEWIGFQTEERVKKGMNTYITLMQKHKLCKVLSDNRQQQGPYPPGIDAWILNDWFGRALKAGFKFAATIMAPGVFTQLSAKQLETQAAGTTNKVFQSENDAVTWLKNIK